MHQKNLIDQNIPQVHVSISNLDLAQIADSGQCFRWRRIEKLETAGRMEEKGKNDIDGMNEEDILYEIPAFHRKLRVMQRGQEFTFFCSEEEFQEIWSPYLDLSAPYENWLNSVDDNDTFLKAAAAHGSGIRILRQDPWEAAVSFIISQCNNIPRIKGCIEKICTYFGDEEIYFPSPERIARLEGEELLLFRKGCSLGYRDEYILNFAKKVAEGIFSLEECGKLPYEECVEQLKSVTGIGQKVADCIALYGFHKIDAFPIDVHMKQILYGHYFSPDLEKLPRAKQLKAMEERHFSRYSGYRGVVQQWIFAYELYCMSYKTVRRT